MESFFDALLGEDELLTVPTATAVPSAQSASASLKRRPYDTVDQVISWVSPLVCDDEELMRLSLFLQTSVSKKARTEEEQTDPKKLRKVSII